MKKRNTMIRKKTPDNDLNSDTSPEMSPERDLQEDAEEQTSTGTVLSQSTSSVHLPKLAKPSEDGASFADLLDGYVPDSDDRLKIGAQVTGTVTHVGRSDIFVSLGGTREGIIEYASYEAHGLEVPQVGESIDVFVKSLGSEIRLELTSGKGALDVKHLEALRDGQTPVRAKFIKANSGGIEVEVAGTRGFCPISQVDVVRIDDASDFVGSLQEVLITEIKEDGRNVIVSRRKVLEQLARANQNQVLEKLALGAILEVTIEGPNKGGFTARYDGLRVFIPKAELHSSFVEAYETFYTAGEAVQGKLIEIKTGERDTQLILSPKALLPEERTEDKPKASPSLLHTRQTGVIARIETYGIFVDLPEEDCPAVLIHKKETALRRHDDPHHHFTAGDSVEFIITQIDEKGRVNGSIKALDGHEERQAVEAYRAEQKDSATGIGTFGDLFGNLKV